MPLPLLRSYTTMLSRLEAQEWLVGVEVTQIGTGRVKKADADALLAQRRRETAPDHRAVRPRTREGATQLAAAAGIAVRVAARRPDA